MRGGKFNFTLINSTLNLTESCKFDDKDKHEREVKEKLSESQGKSQLGQESPKEKSLKRTKTNPQNEIIEKKGKMTKLILINQ